MSLAENLDMPAAANIEDELCVLEDDFSFKWTQRGGLCYGQPGHSVSTHKALRPMRLRVPTWNSYEELPPAKALLDPSLGVSEFAGEQKTLGGGCLCIFSISGH